MTLPPSENLLGRESSPYLRQHAGNPVHWRPWSSNALAEARQLQRPILLSIGYAACHWCHVMAHESFEDDGVAEVMNRLFVNIKVDREERPDIDQIYMASLTAMGEQGGWPMTMFLTPDAKAFWGGTYFPKEARYGRPGFIQVMEAVARTWEDKKKELDESASVLSLHVKERLSPQNSQAMLVPQWLAKLAASIYSSLDRAKGGLRGAPKFPNAPFMQALWLSGQSDADGHQTAVSESLLQMLNGGIYDHVGGGLCRYSTDDSWLVPHFEKMLYDNAQLISLATAAFTATGNNSFRVRIEETIDWLSREMRHPSGGFASSLDADSEGEEGKFYLWSRDDLIAALDESDTEEFLTRFSLAEPDGWEGKPILHRLHHEITEDSSFKAKLLEFRNRRTPPARDDKVLVDWNGLTIEAVATASRVFNRPEWLELAQGAFRFVSESKRDERLPHSILDDSLMFPAMASDYAAMINAAISLCEATATDDYLRNAEHWLNMLDKWYLDEDGLGYYLTASDAIDVPLRIRGDIDEAIPSATAQILRAMLRLALFTSDERLYQRAATMAEAALGRISSRRYGQAGIIVSAELIREPRKLIIVDDDKAMLVSQANRFFDPSRTDIFLTLDARVPSTIMPDGTTLDTSAPGAWFCRGQTCLPPARTQAQLETLLREA